MPYFSNIPAAYPTNLLPDINFDKRLYKSLVTEPVQRKIHNLGVEEDDVWLITLPKCGTTWMAELLWLVLNQFDFVKAKSEDQDKRVPFLEFEFMLYENEDTCLRPIEELKSPRLIKAHLPLPLLPSEIWTGKCKVIYVFRDPRDALVSAYYHSRSVGARSEKSLNEFILDKLQTGYYDQFAFNHVIDFYTLRNHPWLYYTSYEKMSSNLPQVIDELCTFLGKTITNEQMQQMLKHLSFDDMRENVATNHIESFRRRRAVLKRPYQHHNFVRKGQVGSYKDELSEECIRKLDEWIERELAPHKVSLDELLLRRVSTNGTCSCD